ncbi:uncharacterized protein G6M90_00g019960 [Metarhizium brunneum]|uniref:C2H2-type domain-containing protein n=1 Tax=Metarhizium brunneum TaxID=500148 RepID=A0A7D5UTB7_9HYPO
MSIIREDGRWYCKPCNRVFATWEAIFKHKEYMRGTGAESHIHCKFCGQDFKTQAAEISHIIQNHPKRQKLDCPGCGQGPFPRLASLIWHIERGECIRIDEAVLDEMREKKLEFPRQLETLTKESVKNNYTSYVSPKQGGSPRHIWRDVRDQGFSFTEMGFPELSNEARHTTGETPKSDKDEFHQSEAKAAWGGGKDLFPGAPPAQMPTRSQLDTATTPSPRMIFESMDADDPDNPAFNASRYYSDIIEQYICPKVRCGKCFKRQGQLVSHLRSPAHGNRTYRCPYCQKVFKTLTAITSHVESSSVKCQIREADNYEAYLDQLTAGIIDVEERRNEDGTLQYKTAESARAAFRGPKDTSKDHGQVHW